VAELSAALEIESEHPLADAIVKFAAETLGQSMQAPGVRLSLLSAQSAHCFLLRLSALCIVQPEMSAMKLFLVTVPMHKAAPPLTDVASFGSLRSTSPLYSPA